MKTILKFPTFSLLLAFGVLSCSGTQNRNTSDGYDISQSTATAPQTESEKNILNKIPNAPAGVVTQAGGASFIVTSNYFAASGRSCKSIEITAGPNTPGVARTVCDFEGKWGFAPEVLPSTNFQ